MKQKMTRTMSLNLIKREDDDTGGKMIVEGYAAVFDSPAVLWESELTGYKYAETIAKGAFDGADMSRTVLKYNHGDNALVLARTSNKSLKLSVDDHGLKVRAELADTTAGRDLYTLIRGGYIDKMSFAFTVDAYDNTVDKEKKVDMTTVTRIGTVYDVAAVDFPAYEDTEIEARAGGCDFAARDRKRIEDKKRRLELLASL